MKEFKKNIIIRFQHGNDIIRARIDSDKIQKFTIGQWVYAFKKGENKYIVSGDVDTDGDCRTSGSVDERGRLCRFAVFVFENGTDNLKEQIDDIDIIATDVEMIPGRMYVTVQIDYETESGQDDGEVRQAIMSECDYSFKAKENAPYRITDTQICGESL